MNESNALLAEYVKSGSDTAFGEIVTRYVNLVYGTALRLVGGDAQLAEDVAQSVFVRLARKAQRLPSEVMLGGWLHRDTCHVAATLLRGERRRRYREKQAVEMSALQGHEPEDLAQLKPVLDTAINQLEPEDRAAILLRFFEQHDLRSVGRHLGSSEDAARMRVNRALEKLQAVLKQHGVALSAAALGTVLTTEASVAAPVGLGAAVTAAALAGVSTAGGLTAGVAKLLATSKLKFGIVTGLMVACVMTPLVIGRRAQTNLQEENRTLQQRLARQSALSAGNQRLADLLTQANDSLAATKAQLGDLLRLRAEVASLRDATNELAQLRRERQQWVGKANTPTGLIRQSDRPAFIYIGGEVKIPNRYVMTNGMTLASLVSAAHGLTELADKTLIQITRDTGQTRSITTIKAAEPGIYPDFAIEPDDKVFIPRAAGDGPSEPQASVSEPR